MNQDLETPIERLRVADDQFGICPICGDCDDYFNIGRAHWMTCRTHRLKWNVGENLFSSWRHETREDWERNAHLLKNYAEVKPAYWKTHPLPDHIVEGLNIILDHYWHDEASDYQASASDVRSGHVFRHMLELDSWMKGIPQRFAP